MIAGFSRECMNPPSGTRMMGFGTRDRGPGSESIRDDIFVRALYVQHETEVAVIVTFDMCFIGREDSDRYKAVIGRILDIAPRQILLNSSHSHVGPASGYWAYGDYLPPDRLYLTELEQRLVAAVTSARDSAREVTIRAGSGRSKVPMCRRKPMPDGSIENRPYPDGIVCDVLPVCLLEDSDGPVACLFSISAHPSIVGGTAISAEYPGAATNVVDVHLGSNCSMFLQGCGGDAKTSTAGVGRDAWLSSDWDVVEQVGKMLGEEVIALLDGLHTVEPALASALTETHWPLESPNRSEFEEKAAGLTPGAPPEEQGVYELWGARQLELVERGRTLPSSASILIQAIKLGEGLRMSAIEGEPVAEHGLNMLDFYGDGVTFPLGYSNGEAMYLPVTRQLPEGGYEVVAYGEYGYPARLASGMEKVVEAALEEFKENGID